MSEEVLLSVENVSVSYSGSTAVHGVSFQVRQHRVTGLIGPNGAGKSTVLDAIAGLKEYDGRILYDGEEISSLSPKDRIERGLIYCTEERDLFPFFTVRKNLLMGVQDDNRRSVEENLSRVFDLLPRLEERHNQQANTLSGGEQQMLAIGRALMGEPELLLLDEPTQGLAPIVIDNISGAIDRLREEGVTILVAEQNATFALQSASYLYLLETGDITLAGTRAEFRDNERIKESFVGV